MFLSLVCLSLSELMIFWKFLKNFWFLVPWFIRIFWLLIKFDTTRKNNNPKLAGISFLKNIYSIFFPAFFSTSFHNRVCLLNFIVFFLLYFIAIDVFLYPKIINKKNLRKQTNIDEEARNQHRKYVFFFEEYVFFTPFLFFLFHPSTSFLKSLV